MGFDVKWLNQASALGGLGTDHSKKNGSSIYNQEQENAIRSKYLKQKEALNGQPGPKPLAAETNGYTAKTEVPGLDARVAAQTARATQGINAQAQTQNDAVSRRFAAMGAGGSGSAVKATQMVFDNAADKATEAGTQINEAADAERRAFANQESNKEFQSMESLKGRNANREQFNADSEFKQKVFAFDSNSKLSQLEMQEIQMDRDAQDQAFNKEMAQYQQAHSGGLLGSGGAFGTGLSF